jgi:FkbM family methyltransferase
MNEENQYRTEEYLKIFNREKVIKSLINTDSPTIFDVGANVGDTLVEFKKWWPKSTVHCFEPQEECWDHLDYKIKNNNYDDVFINKFAVGDEEIEKAIFYSHDITSGQSGLHKINSDSLDSINQNNLTSEDEVVKYENRLNHERTVEIKKLTNYMDDESIYHVDLMKIDTQGHEPEVLRGLMGNLSKVDVVITELMFYDFYERSLSFSDIEKYLLPADFQLFDISHISKNPMNGRTDWIDVIYINNKIRSNK